MNSRRHCPAVTQELIHDYFVTRTACDQQHTGDIQALRKGKQLVDSKRIEACSLLVSEDGAATCQWNRKGSMYSTRVKFDTSGDICNSDCECPVGKGPHGTWYMQTHSCHPTNARDFLQHRKACFARRVAPTLSRHFTIRDRCMMAHQ